VDEPSRAFAIAYGRAGIAIVALYVGGLLAIPSAGAATAIVKPGSWEIVTTTRISETRTEIPELGKKPTGEGAKAAAEMRRPVFAPDVTRTTRECLGAKAASRWTVLTNIDRDYRACKTKSLTLNTKRFKAVINCAAGKHTGTAEFSATGEQYSGEISMVAHEGAYDRTEAKIVQATWVGRSCDRD
jgi:hypothetical protein